MHPEESVVRLLWYGCEDIIWSTEYSPSIRLRRGEGWNCNAGKVTANLLSEKEPIQLVLFS